MAAEPVQIPMIDHNSERREARMEADHRLDAMREEVERLAGVVRAIAERRLEEAARATQAGTAALRGTIRDNPWLALAAAGTTGALLAMAVTRPTPRARLVRRMGPLSAYAPDHFGNMLDRAHRSIGESSLATRLEQVAESISRIDPAGMANPLAETASRLLKAWRG